MKLIKNLPLAAGGLILSLFTLANILGFYSVSLKYMVFSLGFFFYILYLLKLIIFPKTIKTILDNPLIASSFPTMFMATIVLSAYAKYVSSDVASILWYLGIICYAIYIPYFTYRYYLYGEVFIENTFATWFVVYVGFAVAGVFVSSSGNVLLAKIIFYLALAGYLYTLPIMLYRNFMWDYKFDDVVYPTKVVMAAPSSILFLSYYHTFTEKSVYMIGILFVLSQFFYLIAVSYFKRIFKKEQFPTLAATTFPMVTGAFVMKNMYDYTHFSLLKTIYYVELTFAIIVVLWVLIYYFRLILK